MAYFGYCKNCDDMVKLSFFNKCKKCGAEVTTDKILVDVEWYRKTDEEKAAFINEIKNKPEVTQGSKKAICECCGESLGFSLLKHSVPDLNGVDHPICAACANEAVDKGLKLHYSSELGKVVMGGVQEEIRKKCRVCGKVFCYNASDLLINESNAKRARLHSITGMANALGGNITASAVESTNAQGLMNQYVDYNKCPNCGSTDSVELSKNEYEAESRKPEGYSSVPSPADEIKKYKELLDIGAITQEEYDTMKKHFINSLLGNVSGSVTQNQSAKEDETKDIKTGVSGKCQLCGKENAEIFECRIDDDMGTRYRSICRECLDNTNAELIK